MKKLINILSNLSPAKLSIALCLVIFAFSDIFAQPNKVLWSSYRKVKSDTEKINLLLSLAKNYSYENPDSAIAVASEALQLANKYKRITDAAIAHRRLSTVCVFKSDSTGAHFHARESIRLCKIAKNKYEEANGWLVYGNYYFRFSDYVKAIECTKKSENICLKIQDREGLAYAYGNLSNAYLKVGDYSAALNYQYKCLQINEEMKNLQGIANACNNISLIYSKLKKQEKALEFLFKALKIFEQTNDEYGKEMVYANIGGIYEQMNQHEKGIEYEQKSLEIKRKLGDEYGVAISYNNIGTIYEFWGQYDKAIAYQEKSIEIFKKVSDKEGIALSVSALGSIYLTLGNHLKAEKYLTESVKLCQELGILNTQKENYKYLYDLKKKLNKPAEALRFLETFNLLRDSLNSIEREKDLTRREVQYQYDKKAAADSVKNAEAQKVKDALITASKAQLKQEQTQRFALYGGLALVLVFSGFIYNRFKITQRQKEIIEKQKEEVDRQRELADSRRIIAEEQREIITQQKHLVEEHQKEIIDSINYAKRLQDAILPPRDFVKQHIQDSFILYKPKDIVAGDFYWAEKKDNFFFIAAADCTGHGVPGALVSVVCSNALNRSVKEFGLINTGEILDKTRELVVETFSNSGRDVKDGMDISLIRIELSSSGNRGNVKVQWSGANNPLWIVKQVNKLSVDSSSEAQLSTVKPTTVELTEIKADKQPIGQFDDAKPFTTHETELPLNTSLYLFTDGYADQFGGPLGKKFKYKQMSDLLLNVNNDSSRRKHENILTAFESWKGNYEQVDDVCIIGIKL